MLIHVDDLVVARRVHLEKRLHQTDTGIVENAVQRAELLDGEVHHRLDLVGFRYVDLERKGLDVLPRELRGHLHGSVVIEVGDDDVRALRGEREARLVADAARPARDDDRSFYQFHDYLPSRIAFSNTSTQ